MIPFQDIRVRFFDLYENKDYAGALALLTQHQADYPRHTALTNIWRISMMARLGDTSNAIALLSESLGARYWYHEAALQHDPDFELLQNIPLFQELVEQCKTLRLQAAAESKPSMVTLVPDNSNGPLPLLIVLHGGTGNADTEVDFWKPALDRGWIVAFPQSSEVSWLSGYYEWVDMDKAIGEIEQHIQTLRQQYQIDPFSVVIAGFSAGGRLALEAALSNRLKIRGAITVEGLDTNTFDAAEWMTKIHKCHDITIGVTLVAGAGISIFQEANKLMRDNLRAGNIRCEVITDTHGYHGYGPDFGNTLQHSLDFICNVNAVTLHY